MNQDVGRNVTDESPHTSKKLFVGRLPSGAAPQPAICPPITTPVDLPYRIDMGQQISGVCLPVTKLVQSRLRAYPLACQESYDMRPEIAVLDIQGQNR
ncbi:hypothetical protein, partial [Pseudomonas atacamensis]|uniref:hypothetical protein n=1 Tax=Pseudomonas atacamensis TaxID=2565368 RepID=UPI0037F46142